MQSGGGVERTHLKKVSVSEALLEFWMVLKWTGATQSTEFFFLLNCLVLLHSPYFHGDGLSHLFHIIPSWSRTNKPSIKFCNEMHSLSFSFCYLYCFPTRFGNIRSLKYLVVMMGARIDVVQAPIWNVITYTILPKVLGRPLLMNRFDYFSNFYEYKS